MTVSSGCFGGTQMGRLTRGRPRTKLKSVSRQPEEGRMTIRGRMVREVRMSVVVDDERGDERRSRREEGDVRKQIIRHDMHGNDLISSASLVNCTLGHHWDHSTR
jgi:hypothetical protein